MLLQERYRVVEQIGEGGLGRVYLGTDPGGRRYILKQVRELHVGDDIEDYEVYLRSFQREANILSSLPHPYLPIARDFLVDSSSFVIVMDYIEGRTLSDVQEQAQGPLAENQALRWAIQVCEALTYLHSKKPPIIHRNIKPKNIILEKGESERVRLIGFGLARYFVEGLERDEDNLGTQGYSPPEQYGLAQTDARSDIFGLGATLFALLTQRDPAEFVHFDASGWPTLAFPPLNQINSQVSPQTSQQVRRALQADPQQRFQSAQDMKAALEEILYGEQSEAPLEKFFLGQPVHWEETRSCEFKEVEGSDPVRSVMRNVDTYVVAFLNGEGGRILWGIRDQDRVVVGVPLGYRQRDELRRGVIDKLLKVQPAVAPSTYKINFHEVYSADHPVHDRFVVEVIVPHSQTNLLHCTSDGEVFVKTEAGKKRLSGVEIQDEILRRLGRG
jgi:serine/threonine-protein kinase